MRTQASSSPAPAAKKPTSAPNAASRKALLPERIARAMSPSSPRRHSTHAATPTRRKGNTASQAVRRARDGGGRWGGIQTPTGSLRDEGHDEIDQEAAEPDEQDA